MFDDDLFPYAVAVAVETAPDASTYGTYGAGVATVVQTMSEAIAATRRWTTFGISPLITTVRAEDGGVRVRWVDTSSWHASAALDRIWNESDACLPHWIR